jgi:Holliday junction resolvase-like predicted endonuclease
VEKTNKGNGPGEYDILLINGKSVALIEVKFKAREKYVNEMFKKNGFYSLLCGSTSKFP